MADHSRLVDSWRRGIEEFNRQRYYEAHHDWEQGWKCLPSGPRRDHAQALIQACGVFVHLGKRRLDPAARLCALALEKLDRAQAARLTGHQVEVPGLKALLCELRGALETGGPLEPSLLARIGVLRAHLVQDERQDQAEERCLT